MRIAQVTIQTNIFNGKFTEKSAKFLANQGTHLMVQGAGLCIANAIQPITSFETFMHHKFLVDAAEFIGSKILKHPITAKKQFSNFFSFLADQSQTIIGWLEKFKKLIKING